MDTFMLIAFPVIALVVGLLLVIKSKRGTGLVTNRLIRERFGDVAFIRGGFIVGGQQEDPKLTDVTIILTGSGVHVIENYSLKERSKIPVTGIKKVSSQARTLIVDDVPLTQFLLWGPLAFGFKKKRPKEHSFVTVTWSASGHRHTTEIGFKDPERAVQCETEIAGAASMDE
jgi:hypothetical protein